MVHEYIMDVLRARTLRESIHIIDIFHGVKTYVCFVGGGKENNIILHVYMYNV